MTMDLEKAEAETVKEQETKAEKKERNVGDIVNFHRGTRYVSSYSGSKEYNVKGRKGNPYCGGRSAKA